MRECVDQAVKKVDGLFYDRIERLESGFSKMKELLMLAGDDEDSKLIDIISKHVLDTGMSVKLREIKSEFYSKSEFKTASLQLAGRR